MTLIVNPAVPRAEVFADHCAVPVTVTVTAGLPPKGTGNVIARLPAVPLKGTLAAPRCTIGDVDARQSICQAPLTLT